MDQLATHGGSSTAGTVSERWWSTGVVAGREGGAVVGWAGQGAGQLVWLSVRAGGGRNRGGKGSQSNDATRTGRTGE